jgi:hypothetical protein
MRALLRLAGAALAALVSTPTIPLVANAAPVGPGATIDLVVLGAAGVPTSGVDAVVLNVTATGSTGDAYVTVWPSGQPRPNASNLNPSAGGTNANLVVVPPGAGGAVSLFQNAGWGDLVVDVVGWFGDRPGTPGSGSELHAVTPGRVFDTRLPGSRAIGAGETATVALRGVTPVPASGVASVIVNITSVDATTPSYLTVWPSGSARPLASTVNPAPGRTTANLAVVPLGADGAISVFNAAGSVDVVVDVLGWFGPAGVGDFQPMAPVRLADTRSGPGPVGAVGPGGHLVVGSTLPAGPGLALAPGTEALVNLTATGATAPTYLSIGASGAVDRSTSALNPSPGRTVANLAIVPVGPDGSIEVVNAAGSVQVVVDLLGSFPAGSGFHASAPRRLLDTRLPGTPHVLPVAEAIVGYARDHHDYPASDMFAFCGARIVSPVNGVVVHVRRIDSYVRSVDNPALRGGRSWAVLGDDGVRYYGSHMDQIDPAIQVGVRVSAGMTIGTMGQTGDAGACHLHFGLSMPCPGQEWAVRRGVIWPWPYLDQWRVGADVSPRIEIAQYAAAHPTACADAQADPYAGDAG